MTPVAFVNISPIDIIITIPKSCFFNIIC
jgi:hypothetical protein